MIGSISVADPDSRFFRKADPDPHPCENPDPDMDPHQSKVRITVQLTLGAVEVQNGATKDRERSKWSVDGLYASGTDSHHFEQDPDPDSHRNEKSGLHPHQSKKSEPDPHQRDADPQHRSACPFITTIYKTFLCQPA